MGFGFGHGLSLNRLGGTSSGGGLLQFQPSAVWDLRKTNSMSQVDSETYVAVVQGQPVGYIADQVGNYHLDAPDAESRMVLSQRLGKNMLQDDYEGARYVSGVSGSSLETANGLLVSVGPFGVEIGYVNFGSEFPKGQWYYRQWYDGNSEFYPDEEQVETLRGMLQTAFASAIGSYAGEVLKTSYKHSAFGDVDPAPMLFSNETEVGGPPFVDDGGETNIATGLTANGTTVNFGGNPAEVEGLVLDAYEGDSLLAPFPNAALFPDVKAIAVRGYIQGPCPLFSSWPPIESLLLDNSLGYAWGDGPQFSGAGFSGSLKHLDVTIAGGWFNNPDLSYLPALEDATIRGNFAAGTLTINNPEMTALNVEQPLTVIAFQAIDSQLDNAVFEQFTNAIYVGLGGTHEDLDLSLFSGIVAAQFMAEGWTTTPVLPGTVTDVDFSYDHTEIDVAGKTALVNINFGENPNAVTVNLAGCTGLTGSGSANGQLWRDNCPAVTTLDASGTNLDLLASNSGSIRPYFHPNGLKFVNFNGCTIGQFLLNAWAASLNDLGLSNGNLDLRVAGGLVPDNSGGSLGASAVTAMLGRGYTILTN